MTNVIYIKEWVKKKGPLINYPSAILMGSLPEAYARLEELRLAGIKRGSQLGLKSDLQSLATDRAIAFQRRLHEMAIGTKDKS